MVYYNLLPQKATDASRKIGWLPRPSRGAGGYIGVRDRDPVTERRWACCVTRRVTAHLVRPSSNEVWCSPGTARMAFPSSPGGLQTVASMSSKLDVPVEPHLLFFPGTRSSPLMREPPTVVFTGLVVICHFLKTSFS